MHTVLSSYVVRDLTFFFWEVKRLRIYKSKIIFESYLRDSLVWAEKTMSLDHYQTSCNLFLSVRILPECLLLLICHELYQNHSQRVHTILEVCEDFITTKWTTYFANTLVEPMLAITRRVLFLNKRIRSNKAWTVYLFLTCLVLSLSSSYKKNMDEFSMIMLCYLI